MVLIGLAVFLVVSMTQSGPLPDDWRATARAALTTTAASAVAKWENGGRAPLAAYLEDTGPRLATRFWLFDRNGRECSGLKLPFDPQNIPLSPLNPDTPPAGPRLPFAPAPAQRPSNLQFLELCRNAFHQAEPVFVPAGPRVMGAQRFQATSGNLYVIAALLPNPLFDHPTADLHKQQIGILVILMISGLVCYGLVGYLTGPMLQLRDATGRLAAGDLTARTYAAGGKRRDEVADLGRDFDRMAERIESLVLAQQQLLGDISHELRSPLTRLGMALALARRNNANRASEAQMSDVLDRIGCEWEELNALIERLLLLSRIEAGENVAGTGPVELAEVVDEVVADAQFEAQNVNQVVLLSCSMPCRMIGDRVLLRSALENVVRNALRYAPPRTTVEVALSTTTRTHGGIEQEWAIITVRDYGPGVPEEALSELFRPFYRLTDARERESGGVGLGLAITQRAVQSHGGEVVASNAPGGGLFVELQLPLRPI